MRPARDDRGGQTRSSSSSATGHPGPVKIRELGTAGWEELADGSIVAGQPHGAPSWFPCNDRPSNKAPYRISVTTPTGYRAVANGDSPADDAAPAA